MQAGVCWLSGISLRPGGVFGLDRDERLEGDAVPAFTRASWPSAPSRRSATGCGSSGKPKTATGRPCANYLKNELAVQGAGHRHDRRVQHAEPDGEAGLRGHARLLAAPGVSRPALGPGELEVHNRTMVNEHGGTLPGLALRRVLGKPFCVTEYGHAAPNTYVERRPSAAGGLRGAAGLGLHLRLPLCAPHRLGPAPHPQLLRHRPAPDQDGHPDSRRGACFCAAMWRRPASSWSRAWTRSGRSISCVAAGPGNWCMPAMSGACAKPRWFTAWPSPPRASPFLPAA